MTDDEIMEGLAAWFPLEDHSVRENKFVYISSEAITRRMNSLFGIQWETVCRSYSYDEFDGKWQATAHVDMIVRHGDGAYIHSGIGGATGKDLDMVVKTALVEGKKKAFYEFGGCGYLWNEANTTRIKMALEGNASRIQAFLVDLATESGALATPEGIAEYYGVPKADMAHLPSLQKILMGIR